MIALHKRNLRHNPNYSQQAMLSFEIFYSYNVAVYMRVNVHPGRSAALLLGGG